MAPRNSRVNPNTQVRSPARSFVQSLDNFYQAPRDRRGEQAFDRGMASLQGIVGEKAAEAKEERRSDEFLQGQADAMREAAGEEMKGVKTGSIFRQNSRFYMMGLNETRGKAAAARFKADTARAYEQWEGRHVDDDGSAFREWMNGRIAEFVQQYEGNEYALAGALPVLNETARNFAVQHTGFTNTRLQEESFQAYDDIVTGVFDGIANGDYEVEGPSGEMITDWEAVTDAIVAEADDMYTTDGAAANDRVVTTAIRYAMTHKDPDALLALAQAHTSGKLKLSVENQQRVAAAADQVEAMAQQEISERNAQVDAEQEARREQILTQYGATLADDPYAPMPSFEEIGNDYELYGQLQRLRGTFQTASKNSKPEDNARARMNLEIDMANASSPQAALDVLNNTVASNPNLLTGAEVTKYAADAVALQDPRGLMNDDFIKSERRAFGNQLKSFESPEYGLEDIGIISEEGLVHYNRYLLRRAGTVDTSDPEALVGLAEKAREYAMEMVTREYPGLVREAAANQITGDAARAVGADQAIERQDAEIEAQFRREATLGIGADLPLEAPGGTSVAPQPLEGEPEADPEDIGVETEEADNFYEEVLRRFTDGEDTRPTFRIANKAYVEDEEFASEVDRVSAKYGIPATALLAVMDFETGGTFDPSEPNRAGSGATGLIQFMPKTARALGTSTEELARMSRAEQMQYVDKYFAQWGDRLAGGTVDDVYMAVLWPKAIGRPDSYVIFRSGTTAYQQNRGLDTNGDGTVTKFEAASKVRARYYGY